jgi:hypothetical protein
MIFEKIELSQLTKRDHLSSLMAMEVGDSVFCEDLKQAQSLRSLSYYLRRSRNLDWRFTFRKMDRGWRLIRVE